MHAHLQGSIDGLGIRIPFCSHGSSDLQSPHWITRACHEEACCTLCVSINIMLLLVEDISHTFGGPKVLLMGNSLRRKRSLPRKDPLWTVDVSQITVL